MPTAFNLALGKVIVHLRKSQGLSQTAFAEKIGTTQSTLSRIELGTVVPDAVVFRAIAREAGMAPDELYEAVDGTLAKAKTLAEAANQKVARSGNDWWGAALSVLGAVGIGTLVGLAVAALLGAGGKDDS